MNKLLTLGIIGHPIGHTVSPIMHTLAGRKREIPLTYNVFDVPPADLAATIARFRSSGIDGFNVTVPHKVAVMAYLDEVTDDARLIGAVNTVVNVDGRLVGHNTDGDGFVTAVKDDAHVNPALKKVFVYGAGGAARGVVFGLARAGVARIVIANRNVDRANELAQRVTEATGVPTAVLPLDGNLLDAVGEADIIVNTTSVGMEGAAEGVGLPGSEAMRPGTLAVDIVYRPLDTPFLQQARQNGATTQDGLWMLIRQGDRAFRLWTGSEGFPIAMVREAVIAALDT